MALRLHYRILRFLAVLLICFFVSPHIFAQETSSFFEIQQEFESGKLSVNEALKTQLLTLNNRSTHKCSAPISIFAHKYWDELSDEAKSEYHKSFPLTAISSSESFVSLSGKFRVRYETTGADAVPSDDENNNSVPDYVEWIAEVADSSYDRFIALGFTDIFSEKDAPYDIIVANSGAYGFVPLPDAPYIGIENDFVGFPENTDPEGDQKGAVKVTIAHELKHVFQYVQNGWDGEPERWLEMDATLYEEVMYDEVNDYYNYLDSFGNGNFFQNPTTTLIPGSYEDIVWALFFEERFGNTFWKEVWDVIESQSPLISFIEAIESGLAKFSTGLNEALVENLLWHYASGPANFSSGFGFDESGLYPGPRVQELFSELQTELNDVQTLSRFSARYFDFDLIDVNNAFMKLDYISGSSDVQVGVIAYYEDSSVETRFYTSPTANELNSKETGLSWGQAERVGLVFFNSSPDEAQTVQFRVYDYVPVDIESPQLLQNYPNPFNPNTTITVTLPFSQQVKLTVYDYLGREVRVLADGMLGAGENPVRFDALNLASGIYFYRLETEEKVVTRKMTLIK